jgi:hypothetical protein
LLAANSERMRVAIDSQRDTVELHRVDAWWCTERGAAIEIEALIPISGTDFSREDLRLACTTAAACCRRNSSAARCGRL